MDLSTEEEATAACLTGILIGNHGRDGQHDASSESWWEGLDRQSDQGILLKVHDEETLMNRRRKITELLLYAAVTDNNVSLLKPRSSPDEAHKSSSAGAKVIKVFALPLSSQVFDRAANSVSVVPSPSEGLEQHRPACFLSYQRDKSKRQSLSALFDDATQKRRKLKGRGGESIAQAMANIDRPSTPGLSIETTDDSQNQAFTIANVKRRKSLSRAATITLGASTEQIRPASRAGSLNPGKRSSLHRMESATSPRNSPVTSEPDDTYGNQNKAALTKIVMAGMRLYGLQQKKKRLDRTQVPETSSNVPNEQDAEDEYKLIYHQTFKAVMFTFRKQFSVQLISQEIMRDVVDRFLDLFCTDPMASNGFGDGNLQGFGSQGSDGLGVFDLPSNRESSPSRADTWQMPEAIKR